MKALINSMVVFYMCMISVMHWNLKVKQYCWWAAVTLPEDIGSQCYKDGAKQIYSCYRTKPMGFKWPKNWSEKPQLLRVNKNILLILAMEHRP